MGMSEKEISICFYKDSGQELKQWKFRCLFSKKNMVLFVFLNQETHILTCIELTYTPVRTTI